MFVSVLQLLPIVLSNMFFSTVDSPNFAAGDLLKCYRECEVRTAHTQGRIGRRVRTERMSPMCSFYTNATEDNYKSQSAKIQGPHILSFFQGSKKGLIIYVDKALENRRQLLY